ncbi:MAG: hypothetical protein CVU84_11790 [Firmicutes bacterium HGW-Firmicutes-1]|nr:MAG: hypothetical protein CVU84_11790 [Firmicutes bacterium HGW-Firmicutes-1]
MSLISYKNDKAKRKILAFCFTMIPSAIVGVIEPLKRLQQKGELDFQYKDTEKISEADIISSDIVICIRGAETRELVLVEKAIHAGKYVIYYLDDDLLGIDASQTYNQNYFSNPSTIYNIRNMMEKSHCLWTTNPIIAERYLDFFENVIVTGAPALLLDADGETKKETKKVTKGAITIGYAGGVQHRSFFEYILYDPINRLIKEYAKKVKFEIFGFEPYYMDLHSVDFFPYIKDYKKYKQFMYCRNWDIALAPLPNSQFNACKYFNKYLEYGAIKAAGIYSNVSPFTNRIKNEYNGLLVANTVEDWYFAMIKLIENENLRNKIICAAEGDLRENFSVECISEDIMMKIAGLF